jgi:hypothetical protein
LEFGGLRFNVFNRLLDEVMPPRLDGLTPPAILTAAGSELEFAPTPLPSVAVDAALVPAPGPVERFAGLATAPGFFPSGETEIRAARFPSGTSADGASGPGVAERAMMRRLSALSAAPISGAAVASARVSRCRATGAGMALTGIFGRGIALAFEVILKGTGFFAELGTSGGASSRMARR